MHTTKTPVMLFRVALWIIVRCFSFSKLFDDEMKLKKKHLQEPQTCLFVTAYNSIITVYVEIFVDFVDPIHP